MCSECLEHSELQLLDEVAAERVSNREENSVGDKASCSLPKVYLYCNWPGGMVMHHTPISSRTSL